MWPKLGDLMRERESSARGESGNLVHLKLLDRWITSKLILRLWLARSKFDRSVLMDRYWLRCDSCTGLLVHLVTWKN
jgi:hypothetical protein